MCTWVSAFLLVPLNVCALKAANDVVCSFAPRENISSKAKIVFFSSSKCIFAHLLSCLIVKNESEFRVGWGRKLEISVACTKLLTKSAIGCSSSCR